MAPQVMTHDEKLKVFTAIKPVGAWKEPPVRSAPFGRVNPPIEWEKKIPVDEWRANPGKMRKILSLLKSEKKSASVASSVQIRLRKLFPDESWTCTVREDGIFLKFNGKRQHRPRQRSSRTTHSEEGLFAEAS